MAVGVVATVVLPRPTPARLGLITPAGLARSSGERLDGNRRLMGLTEAAFAMSR